MSCEADTVGVDRYHARVHLVGRTSIRMVSSQSR
jgi:hypothetical protein